MTTNELYKEVEMAISAMLKEAWVDQGHHLTGEFERSITAKHTTVGDREILEGDGNDYWRYVEHGFPKESASMKQFPFLLKYFIARGYPEKVSKGSGQITAGQLAAATIKKWMRQKGMSTIESRAFSTTGRRQNFVFVETFQRNERKIDTIMENGIDDLIETRFKKEKDEII